MFEPKPCGIMHAHARIPCFIFPQILPQVKCKPQNVGARVAHVELRLCFFDTELAQQIAKHRSLCEAFSRLGVQETYRIPRVKPSDLCSVAPVRTTTMTSYITTGVTHSLSYRLIVSTIPPRTPLANYNSTTLPKIRECEW